MEYRLKQCSPGGIDEKQQTIKLLEQQLEWYQAQDRILEEIESKLYEMKEIAEYVAAKQLESP